MKYLRVCAAAIAALAVTASVAGAQDTKMTTNAKDPAMSNGGMQREGSMASGAMPMSKMDTHTMKSCQAMPHDAMMAATKCQHLMAKHSDMFNPDGTMKSGMAPH